LGFVESHRVTSVVVKRAATGESSGINAEKLRVLDEIAGKLTYPPKLVKLVAPGSLSSDSIQLIVLVGGNG
jgi:hypothetical protein